MLESRATNNLWEGFVDVGEGGVKKLLIFWVESLHQD